MSNFKGGEVDANILDQTTDLLSLDFIKSTGAPTTLANDLIVDSSTIDLTSATGFVAGNQVLVLGIGVFYIANQIGAPSGNTITLDSPVDKILPSGTLVVRASFEMAVDGSSTPQIFNVGPVGNTINVDITRISGVLEDGTQMDTGTFGGISKLIKGVVLRKTDGTNHNIFNAKTNGELELICCGDFSYSDKAPAGSFGANFCCNFAGQENHGVVVRLEGSDILELIVQDDLTGLSSFRMKATGHIVEK